MIEHQYSREKVKASLSSTWWQPLDPVLRSMMREQSKDANIRKLRIGMWAGSIGFLGFIPVDYAIIPDVADNVILSRIIISITFICFFYLAENFSKSLIISEIISASAVIFSSIFLIYETLSSKSDYIILYYIFATFFVFAVNIFFDLDFFISFFTSFVVTSSYILIIFYRLGYDSEIAFLESGYFAACFAFSLYVSWRSQREKRISFLHQYLARIEYNENVEKGLEMEEMAKRDPLTGLLNRRGIEQSYAAIETLGTVSTQGFAIALIDVDYFKRYNDYLGHQAGDECLVKISEGLSSLCLHWGGRVGRLGGEEFVWMFPLCETENLHIMSDALQNCIADLEISHPNRADDRIDLTVSAGFVSFSIYKKPSLSAIIEQADLALYEAKTSGRARNCIFDANDNFAVASVRNIEATLRVAIPEGLISVVYQPIWDLCGFRLVGHEALMRIHNPEGEALSPAKFIPVAERSGMILDFSLWLLDKVCSELVAGRLVGIVSVNVSPTVLLCPQFVLRLTSMIANYHIGRNVLALELTEGIDIANKSEIGSVFDQLRSVGVQIWLDDFGAGYAGLSWLRLWDFDVVKLDRDLLLDVSNKRGRDIFLSLTRLLSSRKTTIVVEGIETEEQLKFARKTKGNLGQGFLLGKPTPDPVPDNAIFETKEPMLGCTRN